MRRAGQCLTLRSELRFIFIIGTVSGWLLAGCGQSRQQALAQVASSSREAQIIDDRITAAVYAYLPCVDREIKRAAANRARGRRVPAAAIYRDEPPKEIAAQMELDRLDDLSRAVTACVQEKAAETLVESVKTKLETAGSRLADAIHRYLDTTSSSPLKSAADAAVNQDRTDLEGG